MAPHMSSKTGGSGQWSDWIWNADYQRYYRQRLDINGQYEYDWHTEGPTSAADARAAAAAHTPRDTSIDEISQSLDNTHLQGSSLASDYRSGGYTLEAKSSSRSKSSTSKSKSSSSKSKGKGRVYHEEEDDYDEGEETERETQPTRTSRYPINTSQPQTYRDPQTGQYYEYPTETTQPSYTTGTAASTSAYDSTSAHSSRSRSNYSQQYSQSTYEDDEDEPDLAAAIASSKAQNYGGHSAGESSATSAYANYTYEDETQAAPAATTGTSSYITGTQGNEEQLDPRYRVEPSHRFQPGEIFKVLWSEPQGSGNEGTPSLVSDRYEYRDKYGGKIFVGFRRFIVIANDQGHCTCVPIFTYGGKGCNKRGIKAEKHGIIHEKGQKAKLLSHEPKLGFPPVRVEMCQDGEKLSKESRANYSKLITVEHNVKVFFVGRVVAADWENVSDAVNKCWEDKTHHKKKHSR